MAAIAGMAVFGRRYGLPVSVKRPLYSTTPDDAAEGALSDAGQRFEAFIQAHERHILNYLWRMTGEEQGARDLTQETFLRAWQQFDTVSRYEKPLGWLFRVATNLAISQRRRTQARPLVALTPALDLGKSDPAIQVVERDLVLATLLDLPPRRRAAIVLREIHGLGVDEIAAVLRTTPAAVNMALSRGREQFRVLYLEKEAHA